MPNQDIWDHRDPKTRNSEIKSFKYFGIERELYDSGPEFQCASCGKLFSRETPRYRRTTKGFLGMSLCVACAMKIVENGLGKIIEEQGLLF